MNERLVADNHQTGYAQGRRETFMPDGPSASPENISLDLRREQGKVTDAQRETKQKPHKSAERSAQLSLPFGDAVEITKLISSILDKRTQVVPKTRFEYLADLLVKHGGHDKQEIARMAENANPELVVRSLGLLHGAVGDAHKSDWRHQEGSAQRQIEEKFVRDQIERVKHLNPGELTAQDVKRYIIPEMSGGADEVEGKVPAGILDLREVIARMVGLAADGRNTPDNEEWNQLSTILNNSIEAFNQARDSKHFLPVFELVSAIDDAVHLTKTEAKREGKDETTGRDKMDYLNSILSEDQRRGFENEMNSLDAEFERHYDEMDERTRTIVFRELELAVNTELAGILSGWRDLDEAKMKIIQGYRDRQGNLVPSVVAANASRERALGLDGIREWRATKALSGAEERVTSEHLTRPPARWEEVPQSLSNIYRFVEAGELSVDDLGIQINKAVAMLESIPSTTPETRALQDRLIKELEAFRAFHSFRITMERDDMDPSNMVNVFKQYFDDQTWEHFAIRFGRDERYRDFLDEKEKAVNLFDISFTLYSEKLRQERIKMNIVEEMTRHEIENAFDEATYADFGKWLGVELTPELREQVEKLRVHFRDKMQEKIDDPEHTELRGRSVDEVWGRKEIIPVNGREIKCIDKTKEVIADWHRQETLQGAYGYFEPKDTDGNPIDHPDYGKAYLEIRREELRQELTEELRKRGLRVRSNDGRINEVNLDTLKQSGLLDSTDANAYYMTWMTQWSTYDGIRIYSRDTTSDLDDDFESLVYHSDTNLFFGRQIDHAWEFYHDANENRGRAKENEVNRIWKQYLPGKHHYLFPQNTMAVRWAEFFMTDAQKKQADSRARILMAKYDFDNEAYHEEFFGWMKNVAVMDMVENGEISMGQRNFSEVAREGKIKKFEMIDMFADRTKNKNYSDPDFFQAYLASPTNGSFINLNSKKNFYSTRSARQFPWMTLAMRAHWEIVNKHLKRLFDRRDVQAEVMENNLVTPLLSDGFLEKEQAVDFKRKNLGFASISPRGNPDDLSVSNASHDLYALILGNSGARLFRQRLEAARRKGWDERFTPVLLPILVLLGLAWEVIKRIPSDQDGRR